MMALWRRQPKAPVTVHSDQGSQFTGHDWQDFLRARPDLRQAVYDEWRNQWNAAGRRPIMGAEWNRIATLVMQRVLVRAQEN